MSILTFASYDAVRAAIDTSLGESDLPDEVIGLDLYAGAANRWVLRRDPIAASRTGDALLAVTTAAVCWCAALIVVAMPQLTAAAMTDSGQQASYTRVARDPSKVADALRARAEAELATVLQPAETTPGQPTMFTLARGRRGR